MFLIKKSICENWIHLEAIKMMTQISRLSTFFNKYITTYQHF